MGRQIDEQLWEVWRRRLDRYEQWDGTVAAFCLREGVSTVALYPWRRNRAAEVAGGGQSRASGERIAKVGHDVPEADIRRRFARSLNNFWRFYRPLADSWVLAYNGGESSADVAMGTNERFVVRDESRFLSFLELIGDAPPWPTR